MRPIERSQVQQALDRYAGRDVWLHFEFCRGGFVRNVKARIVEAVLRGDGPYRIGIRCEGEGWVVMENLTHWAENEGEPLFLCALEPDQRLAQALQIHSEPMEA
jgi:hypothetical protein